MSARTWTEQEDFWEGQFGNEYCERNPLENLPVAMWADIIRRVGTANTFLELGANIGRNLHAIRTLLPHSQLTALEINAKAVETLRFSNIANVVHGSILDFVPEPNTWDLVFTSGVLIHLAPDFLGQAYDILYRASSKYILVCEYYNPTPTEISYRGNKGKLFKRDFAGEMLDKFSDLQIVDYKFVWHRDIFPADDLTWFLMEKK